MADQLTTTLSELGYVFQTQGTNQQAHAGHNERLANRTGGTKTMSEQTQAANPIPVQPVTPAGGDTAAEQPSRLSKAAKRGCSVGGSAVKHAGQSVGEGAMYGIGATIGVFFTAWLANKYGANPFK